MVYGNRETSVLIVGAGPVGLTLANLLGAQGVNVLVIDEREELIDYPRGVGIDDESLRTFQQVGVSDAVVEHITEGQTLKFVDGKDRAFATFEPSDRTLGWSRRNSFIQPLVDNVLYQHACQNSYIRLLWQHKLTDIGTDDEGVASVVETPDGTVSLRAQYLVGCDGGSSTVRNIIKVAFDGTSEPSPWLVTDIKNDPVGVPNSVVYCGHPRPHVSIALPHGIRRFEFMLLPGEKQEKFQDQDNIDNLVAEAVPGIRNVDYIRSRVYTHHSRLARNFRVGRVLLAGDAAHVMPVWQGQGYNTGIRDASNLAWKLALVVKGRASPALLDSYESERRPHANAMIRLSHMTGYLVKPPGRALVRLRDISVRALGALPPVKQYFIQMRFKPIPKYDVIIASTRGGRADRALGTPFMQPTITTVDGVQSGLDEVLGGGFSVMGWSVDPRQALDIELLTLLDDLDWRFVSVVPERRLNAERMSEGTTIIADDNKSTLRNWFARHNYAIVIIRPDKFIGAAGTVYELTGLIEQLFGRMTMNECDSTKAGGV